MYRERPVLWDCRLTHYKNRNTRHDALLEICISFGTDKEEIERKIRYLLSHFAHEVKKEKDSIKSGNGTDECYKSKWFAYGSLLFLKDRNKPTTTSDTEGKGIFEEAEIEELRKDEGTQSQRESHSPKKFAVAAKRKSVSAATPVVHEAINLKRSISNKKSEKDEYTLFGEQIAIKMRKLTLPYAKFTVQNMINNVLFEAEMGKFDNPTFFNPQFQTPASPYNFFSPPQNTPRLQPPNNFTRYTHSPSPSPSPSYPSETQSALSNSSFLDGDTLNPIANEIEAQAHDAIDNILLTL